MRYVDEYRDPDAVAALAAQILERARAAWTIMEVCGGQTHAILASGLDALIEERVTLLHGPGCPVCVTPLETLDRALALAALPDVTLCSFGDMLRVPGSRSDLLSARARGADVRVVYSPLDAVHLASREPGRRVVFLAVGFETTAPAVAAAARCAREWGVPNFYLLTAHVRVPPALEAILSAPGSRVNAFLAAGHVCTVMGTGEYEPLAARFRVPIVATGFEPVDILHGILLAVEQLEEGRAEVEIQYRRAVRPEGNPAARALLEEVFEVSDRPWRGVGVLPQGGLALRGPYVGLDAERAFPEVECGAVAEPPECRAAEVLRGQLRPSACPEFGCRCTPEHPLGAPMVSSEGACAAYYRYRSAEATAP
jgi:hydrogenase expression/formation protein HypD